MALFRFEDLEIWQMAIKLGNELFDISDSLESKRLYRFAEQLRGAGMSISNNIAEGAGSDRNGEFKQFLRYARRSCFECANILVILQMRGLIRDEEKVKLFTALRNLSRKIYNFSKVL
jgi:four helix bundle protein